MACRSCLRRTTSILTLLICGFALVLPATAATVNGTLTFTPELGRQAEERAQKSGAHIKQYYWRVPNGAIATLDPFIDPAKHLAVVLEPADGAGAAPAGQAQVIKLRGAALDPGVVVVTPHTKVRFRNTDAFVYELHCAENPQMATGQILPPGQQVDFPFDEPGIFVISDRRFPHLKGYVVVANTVLAQNPRPGVKQGEASFSFENVQPGNYKVKVFYDGSWIADRQVEVTEDNLEGIQITLPQDGQQHQGDGDNSQQVGQ